MEGQSEDDCLILLPQQKHRRRVFLLYFKHLRGPRPRNSRDPLFASRALTEGASVSPAATARCVLRQQKKKAAPDETKRRNMKRSMKSNETSDSS